MKNKEKKSYRKDIEILKRTDIEQLRKKIKEYLTKLYEENGKEEYELELQTTVYNLINYFVGKGLKVPAPLHKLCIQLTDSYVANENLKRAEDVLTTVIMGDLSESKELDLIKDAIYKLQIAKFKVGKQDIKTVVKEANELETKLGGEASFNEMDIVRAHSKVIQYAQFKKLFASQRTEPPTIIDEDPKPGIKGLTKYSQTVYPEMRIRFIDETFRDENGKEKYTLRIGEGKFSEYIIIEIEGENSSIWEQFYKRGRDGKLRIAQNSATYIIPNDRAVELQEKLKAKSEIRELAKEDSRIQWGSHRANNQERESGLEIIDGKINWDSGSYYMNFKRKFNESVGHKYFDVKPLSKKSKPTITGIRKGKKQEENNQQIQTLTPKEQHNNELDNLLNEVHVLTEKYNEAKRTKSNLKVIEKQLEAKIKEVEKLMEERGE